MFFEQSEIVDVLKCRNCRQLYDEFFPPRLLLCCNMTICYTCVHMIEKQSKMKNNYTCIACNKQEPMQNKGFAINNQIAKLITRKPKEIPKWPEAEKLKQNLGDLDDLVNKLRYEMENGENSITEDCKEQRRHIQLVKEKKIEEINKHCDALLLQIDVYEEKCKSKCKEMNQAKQKANELIKSVNESIKQLDAYLRQLKIDEKETIEYNQKMDELKTFIENPLNTYVISCPL